MPSTDVSEPVGTVLDPDIGDLLASLGDEEVLGFASPVPDPPDRSPQARPAPGASRSRDSSNEVRWSQADILVVDDDDDVRSSLATLLRSVGYRVVEAFDGQSALDVLVGTNVNVVVLDLHMAPRDGIWLLEHMEAATVTIVVSAFALYDEATVRTRFGSRVSAFLRKPVAPPRLLEAIRQNLGPGGAT